MTRQELAELIGISRNTLNTWEREKPELIKLINLGLHAEQIILENDRLNKKMKKMLMQLNSGKLQLPKEEVEKSEYIDYRNPADFDEVRVKTICSFLSTTSLETLKRTILKAMEAVQWDIEASGTYEYFKKQTSKLNLIREFSKFIREMKNDKKKIGKAAQVVEFVNKELSMDFNEKDADTLDHIVIMFDYYNVLYDIEDKTEH